MDTYAGTSMPTQDVHTLQGRPFSRGQLRLFSQLHTRDWPSLQPAMQDPRRSLRCLVQDYRVLPAWTRVDIVASILQGSLCIGALALSNMKERCTHL